MTFSIKQNDTAPSLRATLLNGSGNVIDLTGATVRFHMRELGKTTIIINQACTVVNAVGGIVQYDWVAADTDVVGSYQAEFQVTYLDNSIETFPNDGYIWVDIIDDIG
jgi:hypothetical protein